MSDFDLDRFVAGDWPAAEFDHARHVHAAYAALHRHPFPEACDALRRGIRRTAARAGAPDKYSETITLAAVSLVAESMSDCDPGDFADFAETHPMLFAPDFLTRFYSPGRLGSRRAATMFLMPDRARPAGIEAATQIGLSERSS